jgi:SAM-dependent methyltransferase
MSYAKRVIFNAVTFLPGVARLPPVRRILERRAIGTGGTDSARYCYSVWLRHLVLAGQNGLDTNPRNIAELGPGDSLGIGLAALLSGAERYYAFDVVEHASLERNLGIFDQLVELFRRREPIPAAEEMPRVTPLLDDYSFPAHILTNERLDKALAPERVARIRGYLQNSRRDESVIQYRAPWFGVGAIPSGSIDLIFSQAVLEHVDALSEVYVAMKRWLAPGGYVSHLVDLSSHGWAPEWNGHWGYSDLRWSLLRGKDTWMINRQPKSTHLRLLNEAGFRIVAARSYKSEQGLSRDRLARRFRNNTDDDLVSRDLFVQATPL